MVNNSQEQKTKFFPEQPNIAVSADNPTLERSAEALKKTETEQTEITPPESAIQKITELIGARRKPKIVPVVRDEVAVKIEKILEDGCVGDAYQRLSPIAKQEFKLKGEATAQQIRELLKGTHVKIKKVFRLILDWLRLLPGLNTFFLEQEAKIKTDRIIALHQKEHKP